MLIISSYHKKLHCQVGDESIGIEPNQIMTVGDEMGRALLINPWITEARQGFEAPIFKTCGGLRSPNIPDDIPEFIYKTPGMASVDEKEKAAKKIKKLGEIRKDIDKKEELVGEKKKTVETPKEKKVPIRKKPKVE